MPFYVIDAKGRDPTPWLDLFLTAVLNQAEYAVARADRIIALREAYRDATATIGSPNIRASSR